MTQYSKSIAAIVAALATVLISFNIDVSEEIQGAIITLLTAGAVFFAPKNTEPVPVTRPTNPAPNERGSTLRK